MKYSFLFIFLPLFSNSQDLPKINYSNSLVGFSISLDTNWQATSGDKDWKPMQFYNKVKNEKIIIGLYPAPSDVKFNYTKNEAEGIKSQVINSFKSGAGGNVSVDSIWAYTDTFSKYKCIVIEANLHDPDLLNGVKLNYKSIQFLQNNFLINIVTCIPLSNFVKNETQAVKSCLSTIKIL